MPAIKNLVTADRRRGVATKTNDERTVNVIEFAIGEQA